MDYLCCDFPHKKKVLYQSTALHCRGLLVLPEYGMTCSRRHVTITKAYLNNVSEVGNESSTVTVDLDGRHVVHAA